jgi:hypothetical protein
MTTANFQKVSTQTLSLRNAPRKIILPPTVAHAVQGVSLESANDPDHLERGGAIFARKSGEVRVRLTEVSKVTASPEAMTVDRSARAKDDRLLAEFHSHPRSAFKREFELSDPPSELDFDHFAKTNDRMILVTTKGLTYGLLKTAEYDQWWSSLPKDSATKKPFYQQQLSFAFRLYLHDARSRHRSFPRAIAIAAMRVAKEYHIAFYVGGPTTLERIDDRVKNIAP